MRTSFLILFVLFLTNQSHAQLAEKTWIVGGAFEFESYDPNVGETSDPLNEYSTLMLQGRVGRFLKDRFAVGISLTGQYLGFKDDRINDDFSLGTGTFARYYFLDQQKTVNILAEPYYRYVFPIISPERSGEKSHVYGISAGPVIFFNDVAALEFLLNWERRSYLTIDRTSQGFGIQIGFNFHLTK